jgi:hypothetical protein
MKANELRINNLLKIGEEPVRVISLGVNPISTGYILCAAKGGQVYHDGFSPIPLTPEILEKAGFEQRKYKYGGIGWVKKKNTGRIFKLSVMSGSLNPTGMAIFRYWSDNGGAIPKITSLHQLQNIFFALTGEELNIEM